MSNLEGFLTMSDENFLRALARADQFLWRVGQMGPDESLQFQRMWDNFDQLNPINRQLIERVGRLTGGNGHQLVFLEEVQLESIEDESNHPIRGVAVLRGDVVSGTIWITQNSETEPAVIEGEIEGLSPGLHGFHVHQYGDSTNGCLSAGPVVLAFGTRQIRTVTKWNRYKMELRRSVTLETSETSKQELMEWPRCTLQIISSPFTDKTLSSDVPWLSTLAKMISEQALVTRRKNRRRPEMPVPPLPVESSPSLRRNDFPNSLVLLSEIVFPFCS